MQINPKFHHKWIELIFQLGITSNTNPIKLESNQNQIQIW